MAIVPVDHIGQGTEPRDQAVIMKSRHLRIGLSMRMNESIAQEDAGRTTPRHGLIEIEHGRGHLSHRALPCSPPSKI